MEHLLKHRHFDLYTDHENLTRLYSTGSQKVMRWRMLCKSIIIQFTLKKGKRTQWQMHSHDSDREEYLTAVEEYVSSADNIQTLDTTASNIRKSEYFKSISYSNTT